MSTRRLNVAAGAGVGTLLLATGAGLYALILTIAAAVEEERV